jgi:hypothetical protein
LKFHDLQRSFPDALGRFDKLIDTTVNKRVRSFVFCLLVLLFVGVATGLLHMRIENDEKRKMKSKRGYTKGFRHPFICASGLLWIYGIHQAQPL